MERILASTNKPSSKEDPPDLNESFESAADSTQPDNEAHEETPETDVVMGSTVTHSEIPINISPRDERESELKQKIVEAQRQLAALQSEGEESFNFDPTTKEADPKVTKTNPYFLKQGIACQRFDQEGWQNIRYSETQKQFQATPAFCALKVNNLLSSVTPTWKSVAVLEKFDLTLGAITHGLLQQRKIFQDLLDQLPPDLKNKVGRDFLGNSQFKKNSDSLLQYVCGHRAEVIEQRRATYKVHNKALNGILRSIPPSDTHLFSDSGLSQAVKDCSSSDIRKFFPYPNRKKPTKNRVGDKIVHHHQSGRSKINFRKGRGTNDAPRTTPKQHSHYKQQQPQRQGKKKWEGDGKRK